MKPLSITLLIISLLLNIAFAFLIFTKDPMKLQGEKSWVDLYSDDADATIKFLSDNLGIKLVSASKETGIDYRVIKSEKGLFPYAGVMQIDENFKKKGLVPHATIYLTVKNYDEMSKQFTENGAKPVMENMVVDNMKFGIFVIPGGLDVGIIQYNFKR